jgi:CHAD domain-containing protein
VTKGSTTSAHPAAPRRGVGARPLARALPTEEGEPRDPSATEGGPSFFVGPRLTVELRAMQARLEETSRRVLRTGDDLAVHDLRVAIRRTRTLLEVGREVFGRYHADEVRRALTELQRATGALRDEEVLLELVASLPLHATELDAWVATRRRRERRLRTAVRRLVRVGGLDHGFTLLGALLAFRTKPSRNKRLVKFARRAVLRAQREVERRRTGSNDSPALHRLRVAYKRLRYTAETFVDVLPLDLGATLVRTAAGLQKRIGDVHDVDVVVASVQRARGLPDTTRHALLVALSHLRAEREAALVKELGRGDRKPPSAPHLSGADSLRKISIR